MPTENEIRVMKVLTAIEVPPDAAKRIEQWGNEAVTVVCDAALGTYPGLRPKVRTNAAALLGYMDHPQARETVPLLVGDPDPDVAIRAMRAAGRQRHEGVVGQLGRILRTSGASAVLAAEAVQALQAIDSAKAREELADYTAANPNAYPHRASAAVASALSSR